ncbi:U11/U12 small nuclear ribonucleoprotein 59 kDa protein-like [Dendrobium catenatum]|uniref:U11/U12 small nuclear ribonucleoprotein 59 kDa protein-like n=1 Tax=Dendrobium catenatum TaxID=906689 RepID=UPI00109FD4AC|nr:U11/U12 small nuclear ribonucleoprotein 59 kDa protein-like [Dendrobium catenatum]
MIFPTQLESGVPSSLQSAQPIQHAFNTFWRADHVHEHLRNLQETIHLLKSVQKELEGIYLIKRSNYTVEVDGMPSNYLQGQKLLSSPSDSFGNEMLYNITEIIKEKKVCPEVQESLSLEAANSLVATVKSQLSPFNAITSQTSQWEEKSMAVKLVQKLQKYKRNKHWKKRKRKQVAELLQMEHERYDKADEDADEWRAREIAKDIAKRKMESMKSIAKLKAIEERKRLESEERLFCAECGQENLPHKHWVPNGTQPYRVRVRRSWDAYIRPGGSRIPGHWVQPPPPADEVWASYLVGTKNL